MIIRDSGAVVSVTKDAFEQQTMQITSQIPSQSTSTHLRENENKLLRVFYIFKCMFKPVLMIKPPYCCKLDVGRRCS